MEPTKSRYIEKFNKGKFLFNKELEYALEQIENLLPCLTEGLEGHLYAKGQKDIEVLLNKKYWVYEGRGLLEILADYTEFMANPDPMYFTFGKHRGEVVQDIIEEDQSYCHWFSDNVVGEDLKTLQILDFIHKYRVGAEYRIKKFDQLLTNLVREYIPDYLQDYIDKEQVLRLIRQRRDLIAATNKEIEKEKASWTH